jgi:hypothetical protein
MDQRQSDDAERSRAESSVSLPREASSWQHGSAIRAAAMEASYEETHGRFHVDFDEFFIEHTIGELIAMGEDRGESVRQEGVTTRSPDGESA